VIGRNDDRLCEAPFDPQCILIFSARQKAQSDRAEATAGATPMMEWNWEWKD